MKKHEFYEVVGALVCNGEMELALAMSKEEQIQAYRESIRNAQQRVKTLQEEARRAQEPSRRRKITDAIKAVQEKALRLANKMWEINENKSSAFAANKGKGNLPTWRRKNPEDSKFEYRQCSVKPGPRWEKVRKKSPREYMYNKFGYKVQKDAR